MYIQYVAHTLVTLFVTLSIGYCIFGVLYLHAFLILTSQVNIISIAQNQKLQFASGTSCSYDVQYMHRVSRVCTASLWNIRHTNLSAIRFKDQAWQSHI